MPRQPTTPGLLKEAYLDFTKTSITRPRHRLNISSKTIYNRVDGNQCDLKTVPLVSISQEVPASRFLALPIELRFMIYTEVLRVQEYELSPAVKHFDLRVFQATRPRFVNLCRIPRREQRKHSVLNLLEVCGTIYREAQTIFYQINHLRVSSPAMLFDFLSDLPKPRRSAIRNLRVGGVGFHYSGRSLTARAFSMLPLCHQLRRFEIELVWNIHFLQMNPDREQVMRFLMSVVWVHVLGMKNSQSSDVDYFRQIMGSLNGNRQHEVYQLQTAFTVLFNLACIKTLDISLHITYRLGDPPLYYMSSEIDASARPQLSEGFGKVKEQWDARLFSARKSIKSTQQSNLKAS